MAEQKELEEKVENKTALSVKGWPPIVVLGNWLHGDLRLLSSIFKSSTRPLVLAIQPVQAIYCVITFLEEIGIMGVGPLELVHLVLFTLPFIWVWLLGWLGFGIFWSILTAISVFAFRLSKLKYKSGKGGH